MPASPSISALSNGSGPPAGSSNTHSAPSRRALTGITERHGPSSLLVLSRPLGMGDDMRREDDRRAFAGLGADQLLEPRLVDGVEAGERLVEDDQPRIVN